MFHVDVTFIAPVTEQEISQMIEALALSGVSAAISFGRKQIVSIPASLFVIHC
jgi:hypothetical protein